MRNNENQTITCKNQIIPNLPGLTVYNEINILQAEEELLNLSVDFTINIDNPQSGKMPST
ncbi:hypothetical protein SAMN05428988_3603 [Chitinophaga sp. YR573]|uniref:hypothetical protein n=1 Tax=Chitinophaga sp. YR573 TaxID=1881040 RepID=UPI0008C1CFF9|nr:hypothetical protein [Chitinophaga sp. YR573]SEW25130.1 hypothetical protein SAMN05428988_3603 [Chitinophaga sp. YR573]